MSGIKFEDYEDQIGFWIEGTYYGNHQHVLLVFIFFLFFLFFILLLLLLFF